MNNDISEPAKTRTLLIGAISYTGIIASMTVSDESVLIIELILLTFLAGIVLIFRKNNQ